MSFSQKCDPGPENKWFCVGKRSSKSLKKLCKDACKGKGRLRQDVEDAIEQAKRELGADAEGKEFHPVVLLYERKKKKKKDGGGFMIPVPFPPFFIKI